MPAAIQLGDPLEGRLPGGDVQWWKEQLSVASTPEQHRIVTHNQAFITRFAEEFRGRYFVTCWTMNDIDTPEMWRAYTSRPESVVISTSYQTLERWLPKYVLLGIVRYFNHDTDRVPTFNMLEYIMHKDVRFSFEKEIRGVALQPASDEDGLSDFRQYLFQKDGDAGFHVFAPPVDVAALIQRVVLHPAASDDFEADVRKACDQHGLSHPERSRLAKGFV